MIYIKCIPDVLPYLLIGVRILSWSGGVKAFAFSISKDESLFPNSVFYSEKFSFCRIREPKKGLHVTKNI